MMLSEAIGMVQDLEDPESYDKHGDSYIGHYDSLTFLPDGTMVVYRKCMLTSWNRISQAIRDAEVWKERALRAERKVAHRFKLRVIYVLLFLIGLAIGWMV